MLFNAKLGPQKASHGEMGSTSLLFDTVVLFIGYS